jgi:hypothetical protein
MGLTAFTRDPGILDERIQPVGWTPQDSGSWVFVLGRDVPGWTEKINAGDSVEIAQLGPFVAKVFRFPARMRPPSPANLPLGVWWRCSVLVDGVEVIGKVLPPTRQRDFHDLAWCFSHLPTSGIAFKLQLLGTSGTYEVEIPAFYLDALELDTGTARPALINRDPEPNETGVPADTSIAVDLIDVGADGIDLTHTTISVNGVHAFVNGAFQTGFTGPFSSVVSPQADTQRITIDPLATFASEAVVTVRVQTQTLTSAITLDQSYSFTVERLRGPMLTGAVAVDQQTLNVTFDEPVRMVSAANGDDALNPSNYTVGRELGTATVALQVLSVTPLTSSSVALGFDIPMTPGADYTVTASNVRDLFGNEVRP